MLLGAWWFQKGSPFDSSEELFRGDLDDAADATDSEREEEEDAGSDHETEVRLSLN